MAKIMMQRGLFHILDIPIAAASQQGAAIMRNEASADATVTKAASYL